MRHSRVVFEKLTRGEEETSPVLCDFSINDMLGLTVLATHFYAGNHVNPDDSLPNLLYEVPIWETEADGHMPDMSPSRKLGFRGFRRSVSISASVVFSWVLSGLAVIRPQPFSGTSIRM